MLVTFEIEFYYDPKIECIKIVGSKNKIDKFIEYIPANDHRVVMTAELFMKCNEGGRLFNYDSVKKS